MMTVLKSVRSRKFLAALTALVSVAAMLVGAGIASADEVWFQSYQRASASDICVAQAGETPWQDSWGPNPGWSPSWERWANNGQGGWVCSRSITWARDSASRIYNVGDVGPGGGLVFLISGGRTYEMAPQAWSGAGTPDDDASYCDTRDTDVPGAAGTAVGTGAANTAAMAASSACSSDAAAAVLTYPGNDSSAGQWFLPSKDELNAMYGYKSSIVDTTKYGFASDNYWSSSQHVAGSAYDAWWQSLDNGVQDGGAYKNTTLRVRPVRAF